MNQHGKHRECKYFVTVRVPDTYPSKHPKLHRIARSEDYTTLKEARVAVSDMMSFVKDREGAVATIFRVGSMEYAETIEHAVIHDGEIIEAYRTSSKWYLEVAPYIATSEYYNTKGYQPPFLTKGYKPWSRSNA